MNIHVSELVIESGRDLLENNDEFWLIGALSDGGYEERIKPGSDFGKYVESYRRVSLDPSLVQQLELGVNGNLALILKRNPKIRSESVIWDKPERNGKYRPDILFELLDGPLCVMEVKQLHDCTKEDHYVNVAADLEKLKRICGDRAGFLLVFFTQLPCFDYPPGRWQHVEKTYQGRRVDLFEKGIRNQFQCLRTKIPLPPTYPTIDEPHFHQVAFPKPTVLAAIHNRYESVFQPRQAPWRFDAERELRDTQVALAVWQVC